MAWPLPSEITGRIVSLIENPLTRIDTKLRLAQYATVNRDWQPIIEERSWAKIQVKTGIPLNLDEFERLTKDPRRQSYIRDIELIVELEPYDEAARAQFETEFEHERNNQIFSEAIRSVLQIVAKWRPSQGISLSIKVQSPSDLVATPNRLRRIKAARGERTADILNRRFERNYLRLNAFESQTAPISIVHSLKIEALADRRQIEAISCARLVSRFPNLHTLKLLLNDTCKRDKGLRKRNRDDDVTDEGVDPLSLKLHKFSQQLETLSIDGMTFGNELFWPPESNDNSPSWPDLKTISIDYMPTTPSGKWLFVDRSDRDEDDQYESMDSDPHDEWPEYVRTPLEDRSSGPFREVSVPGLFNELYMAVGQAALRMPKLEDLRMDTESGRVHHRFRYSTEGEICATWSDRLGFQPEERVLELWKQVASEHTGQSLKVKLTYN
ncbi:uncharacterized protein N7484_008229 [Penicillium longicatenatum]|uniref:uncharacterized protein n=1 Tax=Penicillium longicatenatum TaxID=1561947 RepID=UPI0025490D14|nr:uncharacterized protein N7484_008229 [Penicillium longicatenatum]KAJ5640367.1 hypothetical protein N7484_008229 [Penicillium longicatenatum]